MLTKLKMSRGHAGVSGLVWGQTFDQIGFPIGSSIRDPVISQVVWQVRDSILRKTSRDNLTQNLFDFFPL